ncbi:related to zinc-binding oxidoreductase ToxD [Phialocephala subalpina]|uniref:Related to zinc-binding oxidoreductase ToxD n=1 Tax=Phialocephala subalpina TaxID=576137 RepID=A0A1L7XBW0_9HELO|nr:related to zinc-binding oxidoreductase ToxD [Phialocephala subalpina]
MQAIQLEAKGGPAVFVKDRPLPKLPKDCLLVKTVAVGLNPHELVDIYPPYTISSPGDLLGCDYSGIVLEVGSEVTRPFKKGDRVCGCTRPNPLQPDWGTFAEFIVVVGDVQLRIPEGMGFEDAASLGVTVLTSGAVLCDTLGLPMPTDCDVKRRQILVYGGSTSMGRMILQSNFDIITTCSPNHFEMVKSLGADHVFDYNDPNAAAAIEALTKGNLSLCVDCFSEESGYEFCSQVLSTGATYVALRPMDSVRPDLDFKFCMGVMYFDAPFLLAGHTYEAPPGAFESAVKFAVVAEKLLAEDKIKPHPKDVRTKGLAGILDGIQELKEGKVRGVKLVYTLS